MSTTENSTFQKTGVSQIRITYKKGYVDTFPFLGPVLVLPNISTAIRHPGPVTTLPTLFTSGIGIEPLLLSPSPGVPHRFLLTVLLRRDLDRTLLGP